MIPTKLRRYLPLIIFLAVLALGYATGYAQDEAAAPERKPENIIQTIRNGGFLIMLIWFCIVGTSVTMVTLIIQNATHRFGTAHPRCSSGTRRIYLRFDRREKRKTDSHCAQLLIRQ